MNGLTKVDRKLTEKGVKKALDIATKMEKDIDKITMKPLKPVGKAGARFADRSMEQIDGVIESIAMKISKIASRV